ncbi:MAG: hypothetical protein ACK5LC_08565 [Coprobacillaceae bacterium]
MEIQVSKYTVDKVIDTFRKNKMVTRKDIPDLDCPYIGDHLEHQIQNIHKDVQYRGVYPSKTMDCIGVLYSNDEYNDTLLMNRLKKIKF